MAIFIPNVISASVNSPVNVFINNYAQAAAVSGFKLAITSATTATLQPGFAQASNTGFGIYYPSGEPNQPGIITIDTSVTGANGCYPNPLSGLGLANATTFGVYVLGDDAGTVAASGSQTAGTVAVIATGNNFLLPGYTSYRRVGLVRIDTSGNLIPMVQAGNSNDRNYMFADAVRVLTTGSATTPTLVDLTVGDGPVIPGASSVSLLVEFQAAVQTDSLMLIPTGLTALSVPPIQFENAVTGVNQLSNVDMVPGIDPITGDAAINYSATAGGDVTSIWVSGFTDSLGFGIF
jgi:hypothetical protein